MWEAVAALVASAALQQVNNSITASRQNRVVQEAMKRQRDYQMQAEKVAKDNANEYQQDVRADKQEDIRNDLTEKYYQPVESAQVVNSLNATTQGDVSSDYQRAKAASDANQLKTAQQLARLMGQLNSAHRLRQNEAMNLVNSANQISKINNFAAGRKNVDDYAIKQAGQADPLLQLGSTVLGIYGASGLASAAGAAGSAGTTSGVTSGLASAGSLGSAGSTIAGGGGISMLDKGIANSFKGGISPLSATRLA